MKNILLSLSFLVAAVSLHAQEKPTVYTDWPFDAKIAIKRQEETAKAIKQPVVLETTLPGKEKVVLTWRLIPAGKFMMGSPATEPGHEGDERLHAETVAEPFYMLETQLTVGQYRALLGEDPSEGAKDGDPKIPAGITYRDTVDKVLPALAKHAPEGWKVILPDQVRLEYAARAGVATMNPGGEKPEDAGPYAWTRENSEKKVHPVGLKKPNAWGLHDVIGNRWHWFWRAGAGYGDASTKDHIVYGGTYRAESGGNGARLANIMISNGAEGARFALIRDETALPKGHPESRIMNIYIPYVDGVDGKKGKQVYEISHGTIKRKLDNLTELTDELKQRYSSDKINAEKTNKSAEFEKGEGLSTIIVRADPKLEYKVVRDVHEAIRAAGYKVVMNRILKSK